MTEQEFATMYATTYRSAVAMARRICGEHAEDAVQDAAASFVPRLARIPRMTPSYFKTRVRARAIDYARKIGRRRGHEIPVGDALDLGEFEAGSDGCTAMEGDSE